VIGIQKWGNNLLFEPNQNPKLNMQLLGLQEDEDKSASGLTEME